MTPLKEFNAPPPPNPNPLPGYIRAGGAVDNGRGQWDGIVGRLSNVHTSPVGPGTVQEFHAVVGGVEQDGLWGIVELPNNRFVVVGSTQNVSHAAAALGAPTFPFTLTNTDWNNAPEYCVGVTMVFDATPTRTGTPPNNRLVLEASSSIGGVSTGPPPATQLHTHASDVAVHLDAVGSAPLLHRILVAGTTDDPALFSSLVSAQITPTVPMPTAVATTNGFILAAQDFPTANLVIFLTGSFQGNTGLGGWCGVGAWNEHLDHATVFGHEATNSRDFAMTSFFADTPTSPLFGALLNLRSGIIPATPVENPAKMGAINATTPMALPTPGAFAGLAYGTEPFLGSAAGGGVAVDERGRVNMVGSTGASGYPVEGGPLSRTWLGGQDAIRTVVDMIPAGVGRSDGTGAQVHNGQPIPAALPGTTGATTPTCALVPFGTRVGIAPGGVPLRRMLIDWEGDVPAPSPGGVSAHAILVDRTPPGTQVVGSIIQFGVPTAPSAPGFAGLENWVPFGVTHSLQLFAAPNFPLSVRVPLVLPPGTGATFSVQAVTFFTTPLTCTGQAMAATPAIVFSY